MKAYLYNTMNNKIIDIYYNVKSCGKDFIKGENQEGQNKESMGINLNRVNYIVTDMDLQIGNILPSNIEDKRDNILSKDDEIKKLQEQVAMLMEMMNNK